MLAKQKLLHAMESLLQAKDLDDICVSEIVATAGLSRKTFYRQFKDRYDLVESYFSQFFEDTFGQIVSGEDWDTALLKYLDICEQRANILRHAYSSLDVNGLRNCDIEMTKKTYETYLLAKGADVSTTEMQFAIEIASRGGTDMVIRWLKGGMQQNKEELKNLIKRTLPQDLLQYLK